MGYHDFQKAIELAKQCQYYKMGGQQTEMVLQLEKFKGDWREISI